MSEEVLTGLIQESVGMMGRGDYINATVTLERVLRKDSNQPDAWNNRALCLLQLGHPFDALMNIDRAISLEPFQAAYHNNRGAILEQEDRWEDAEEAYKAAIQYAKCLPEAWNNLGNTKKHLGDTSGSIEAYKTAIELRPDYADAHLHLSCVQLATGDYQNGWKEFEWRWRSQLPPRGLAIPQWEGEDLTGKTILIYAEQGHGDSLQFIRYVSELKKKYSCYVLVEIRQPLVRLLSTVKGIDKIISFGDKIPENVDYCSAMLSLPRVMGTTVETIPAEVPYFHINQDRIDSWKESLKLLPPGMKVGVCWAGMSRPGIPAADRIDKMRSTTLSSFAPLAKIPGISWVSLQKGPPASQITEPPPGMTIGDWMDGTDDFYDTAALIENLDLVISVDTAVLHVAAALDKPTWLLSRHDGCWRWLGTRKDSPWYPSLRQYTQPKMGDWASVMQEVAIDLDFFVKNRDGRVA